MAFQKNHKQSQEKSDKPIPRFLASVNRNQYEYDGTLTPHISRLLSSFSEDMLKRFFLGLCVSIPSIRRLILKTMSFIYLLGITTGVLLYHYVIKAWSS